MRILVAEDEDNIALAYEFALKGRGHQVKLTRNGRECVEEYLKNSASGKADLTKDRPPFDIVIMDYRMPEMDGLEAAEEILKVRPDQRIIFASAYARDTLVEAIHQLHFVAELLQKPFDLRALIKAIEDTDLASQLQFLNDQIRNQSWVVTPKQISDLADAMLMSKDVKIDLKKIFSGKNNRVNEVSKTTIREH